MACPRKRKKEKKARFKRTNSFIKNVCLLRASGKQNGGVRRGEWWCGVVWSCGGSSGVLTDKHLVCARHSSIMTCNKAT